jgi:putative aldouronate transport system permease protein
MPIKRTRAEKTFSVFNVAFLAIFTVACVYPVLYVLFASMSDPNQLMKHSGALLGPLGFTLEGYRLVLADPFILTGYANTLFYVTVGTTINVTLTALGAYSLSRKRFFWAKPFMFLITFTMFFQGGLVPLFLLVRNLGLYGTRMAVILPTAVSAWNLIIMRTSMGGIPVSLEECAKMDGANDFFIFVRIIVPLSKAVIAVITLFYAVTHWNSWFNALIFLKDRQMYPLQLILREIILLNNMDLSEVRDISELNLNVYRYLIQYSTIIVAIVPILLFYPFLQRYFVKGVFVGSIKG